MKDLDRDGFFRVMDRAKEHFSVFPLTIHPDDWWGGPHLPFPDEVDGQKMTEWHPAVCRHVDGKATFMVGFEQGEGTTGVFEFSKEEIEDAALNFTVDDLMDGGTDVYGELRRAKFFELGFYGDVMRMMMHEDGLSPEMSIRVTAWSDEYFGITPEMKERLKKFEEDLWKTC